MAKNIYVRDSSEFELSTTTLWTLYNGGSLGKETKGPKIDRATGFLQRLAQTTIWKMNDNAKCKEYIASLIKGSSKLDSFVCVPAPLLLDTVEDRITTTSDEVKESWIEVKEYLENRVANGTKHFIIDGQNRLFESIIPFFDNDISLTDSHSLTFVVDGKDYDAKGRKYEDLPDDIQEYIKNIKVPYVTGIRGDLEQFCNTLIWKNEGVAWDDWQKMVTKNWFTKYLRQIREISDKDKTDPLISNVLGKIAGKDYEYERNGWDRIVSELFMWMVRGVQSTNLDEAKLFFEGNYKVSKIQVDSLKKYLKEFSQAYSNVNPGAQGGGVAVSGVRGAKGITNTELRNYIYLRYALDNPKKDIFEGVSVPSWEILAAVKFACTYKKYNSMLMGKAEHFGELPNRTYAEKKVGGRRLSGRTPGSYAYVNSKTDKSSIKGRLEILFSVLAGRKEESIHVFEELTKQNVIVASSSDNTPSMAEIHEDNPFTADGDKIDIVNYDDTSLFDIGHVTPRSQGGSNQDVVLQKVSQNRKLQDNPIPT